MRKLARGADPLTKTVARNVRKRRLVLKLSIQELANRAETRRPLVSRLEGGYHTPTLQTAAKIAKVLGCGVDDLLREDA